MSALKTFEMSSSEHYLAALLYSIEKTAITSWHRLCKLKGRRLKANRKLKEKKMSKHNQVMAVRAFGLSTMAAVTFGWIAIIKMAFIG
jgi:hypothetical protein